MVVRRVTIRLAKQQKRRGGTAGLDLSSESRLATSPSWLRCLDDLSRSLETRLSPKVALVPQHSTARPAQPTPHLIAAR